MNATNECIIHGESKAEVFKRVEDNMKRGMEPLHPIKWKRNANEDRIYYITMGWENGQAGNDR